MSKRPWRPVGVFPAPVNPKVLSDDDWEYVASTFKEHMHRPAPARLREALNDALRTYLAWEQGVQSGPSTMTRWQDQVPAAATPKQIRVILEEGRGLGPATPKPVRAKLKSVREALLRVLDRLNHFGRKQQRPDRRGAS